MRKVSSRAIATHLRFIFGLIIRLSLRSGLRRKRLKFLLKVPEQLLFLGLPDKDFSFDFLDAVFHDLDYLIFGTGFVDELFLQRGVFLLLLDVELADVVVLALQVSRLLILLVKEGLVQLVLRLLCGQGDLAVHRPQGVLLHLAFFEMSTVFAGFSLYLFDHFLHVASCNGLDFLVFGVG